MIGRTRWRFRAVDSTQNIAFRLAELGADSGTVVRANHQSAGRGRLGRTWEVPANTAMMFSVLLRPEVPLHRLGSLSIYSANVLCDVFESLGVDDVCLKWPNDVLVNGRKVSGILLQTRVQPNLVAVVGIGINIFTPQDELPPTAISLSAAIGDEIDIDALFDNVLAALDHMWSGWQSGFTTRQIESITSRLWLNGQQVTLLDADRVLTGMIAGIAPDGALRLIVDGTERIVHAGEITRGPRPIDREIET